MAVTQLRIISVMLDTCGCFFDRGSTKKKLDIFIQYFLRYFFWKKELFFLSDKDFPLGMEHSVRDVIEQLRPRLKFPTTLEECLVAVEKIEREAAEKLEQMGLNNGGLGMFRFSETKFSRNSLTLYRTVCKESTDKLFFSIFSLSIFCANKNIPNSASLVATLS